jgi:molecular chaperone GrpE
MTEKRKKNKGKKPFAKKDEFIKSEAEDLKTSASESAEIPENDDEIQKAGKDNQNQNEKLVRLMAEFENFRRRTAREKADLIQYSLNDFLKSLIPIIDDLQRTLDSIDKDNPVYDGIQMVKDKFENVLGKNGVKTFDSIGETFNPELHDAMLIQDSDEFESQKVIQEFEKGYYYHDKILRHARVVVAK